MVAEEKAMQSTDRALDAADTVAAKVTTTADGVVTRALDATEHVVRCALGDVPCIRREQAGGASVVLTDTAGRPVSSADSARAIADAGAAERLLFFEDYAKTEPGAFPATLKRAGGAGGVHEENGERRLRATSRLVVLVPLADTLPSGFTVEFDVVHAAGGAARPDVTVHLDAARDPSAPHVLAGTRRAGVAGVPGVAPIAELAERGSDAGSPATVRIVVDGESVVVEIDGVPVGEWAAPGLSRGRTIALVLAGSAASPVSVGPIRVAALLP
jgi:hypothetical protein